MSKSNPLYTLITLRDIIIDNKINNSIYISFDDKKDKEIKIKNNKIIKIEEFEDIIFIEIKPNTDGIKANYFNELNDNNDKDKEKSSNIYILYYFNDNAIGASFCSLLNKKDIIKKRKKILFLFLLFFL